MKTLKEKITRLEKERGSTKSPDSDQLQKLIQERDKLQRERDNLNTDLKKVTNKQRLLTCQLSTIHFLWERLTWGIEY